MCMLTSMNIFAIWRLILQDYFIEGYDVDGSQHHSRHKMSDHRLAWTILLVIFLFTCLLGKLLFYLQVLPRYRLLVDLVLGAGKKIKPFIIFLIMIMFFFAVVYTLIGGTFGRNKHLF